MTRLGFSLLAAAMLVSALALWWRPQAAGPPAPGAASGEVVAPAPAGPDATPEATEAAAAPARVGPVAPPAAVASPPAPEPVPLPAPAPEPAAPQLATPRLEEEPVEVVTAPRAFSEAPADPWLEASVGESAPPSEADAGEAPPVDVERSGDLIRRMLVLYDAMRD